MTVGGDGRRDEEEERGCGAVILHDRLLSFDSFLGLCRTRLGAVSRQHRPRPQAPGKSIRVASAGGSAACGSGARTAVRRRGRIKLKGGMGGALVRGGPQLGVLDQLVS